MLRLTTPLTLRLSPGELIDWQHPHDVRLSVEGGLLWVTVRHQSDDHFLFAGQQFTLPRGAAALIGAERDTVVRLIVPPTPASAWLRRGWERLGRRLWRRAGPSPLQSRA